MKISAGWTASYEFACHSKACAPPPVGTGGSKESGGGRRKGDYRDFPIAPDGLPGEPGSLNFPGRYIDRVGDKDVIGLLFREQIERKATQDEIDFRNGTGRFTQIEPLVKTGFRDRADMPQFTGVPRPNTPAAMLPRSDHGTVNATNKFKEYLERRKVRVESETIPAKSLKSTQTDLHFGKMYQIYANKSFDPKKQPVIVSNDNYILDGHHRWGGMIMKGRDFPVPVTRIDLPIKTLLNVADEWTRKYGLEGKP